MTEFDYVQREVNKLFENKEYEFPLNIAMASAWILGNYKANNLKLLNVSKKSTLSDYFILASAENLTQAYAMADRIQRELKRLGFPSISIEGMKGSDWILLDHGDILIHIFLDTSREVYDLDGLWKDCTTEKIPEYFYTSTPSEIINKNEEEDYF